MIKTTLGMVKIHPVEHRDAPELSLLRQEALRDNPTAFGSSFEAKENCSLEWAQHILADDPTEAATFLAESDGMLLGMAGIRRGRGRKTRHSASIWGVFVRPQWRGQGIVDGLFRACFDWAHVNQVIIIKLAVVTTNRAALGAYERLGFRHYGTEPKVIFYNGIYYDEYLMSFEMERMRAA